MERYRSHLILVKAHQEPDTDGWSASVHVQFNEGTLTFRDVQLPAPTSHFPTKTTAEKHALKEAKQWVDRRLREAKIFWAVDSSMQPELSLRASLQNVGKASPCF